MRKRELLEQNSSLYNRLQSVTDELEKYKKLYDENIEEINYLRRELAEMEIKANELASKAAEQENSKIPEPPADEEPQPVANEPVPLPIIETNLDSVLQFGAEVIGRIVIEGTKANNAFTEKPNEYSKDLINLVLGKTEVCKAAIFDVCGSSDADSVKRAKILEIEKDTIEYFENLYKQI